jgi:ferredoxin
VSLSEAEIARALDALAAPQVVDCIECGAEMVLERYARLYCSELCRQALKLIHYGRAVVADGRIQRDPAIEEAIQMRIAQILGGGYDERIRRVTPALRAQVFERDGGKCVLCGAPATQIDHIAGDANTLENLRSACGLCNLGMAQARLVPACPSQAATAERLVERIFAPVPLFLRDDETAWAATYSRLMTERRARLRDHNAVMRLLGRAKAAGGADADRT